MSMTPPRTSSVLAALAPKHQRLAAVIEKSARSVETGARTGRSDIVDLQRQAIASVQQCADAAIELAARLGGAACPRDSVCLHYGHWSRCEVCFEAQVGKFLDQAGKFLTAVMLSTEPRRFVMAKPAKVQSRSCDRFPERAASFTEAQQRVFELLVTGLPNKLIAYEIGVSQATVKAHVSAVLRKLGVRSRAQAIALSSAFERDRNEMSITGLPLALETVPQDPDRGDADGHGRRHIAR
jgi:DNA-binding CsgD family transcriptional regulator